MPVSFARPDGFDTLAHLALSMAILPRAHAIEVRLAADLATVQHNVFATIGTFAPDGDGVRLFAQTDDLDWFARELARLPFDFEICAPDALRAALRRHCQRLQRCALA